MALAEALSIIDYEQQRKYLNREVVRVFLLYTILLQNISEIELGQIITDVAFSFNETVFSQNIDLRSFLLNSDKA